LKSGKKSMIAKVMIFNPFQSGRKEMPNQISQKKSERNFQFSITVKPTFLGQTLTIKNLFPLKFC